MQITLRFFAQHRDIVGAAELSRVVAPGTTMGALWAALCEEFGALAPGTRSVMFAVNQSYVTAEAVLHEGDEAAFIPPVSGGAGADDATQPLDPPLPLFWVGEMALDSQALEHAVTRSSDGAVVVFKGVVRREFGGRPTAFLVYEAFVPLAIPVLAQIADEARTRWEIGLVAVHHRTGRLEIGETAVVVAVAAPHRPAAFMAAAWIMERIKEIAPIWKREQWVDGEAEWVGSEKERNG